MDFRQSAMNPTALEVFRASAAIRANPQEKVFGLGFNDRQMADGIERIFLDGTLPALAQVPRLVSANSSIAI